MSTNAASVSSTFPASSSSSSGSGAVRFPVFFISHFGGPNFYMDYRVHGESWRDFDENSAVANQFRAMRSTYGLVEGGKYGRPRAIVVVSAHYISSKSEGGVRISAKDKYNSVLYDYGGFPIDNRKVTYPAPGNVQLSNKILSLFTSAGIKASLDERRNFDHGVYNVLHVLFPDADIPVIAISTLSDFDPRTHIAMGEALSSLRDEGILLVGSGETTHNFAATNGKANRQFAEAMAKVLEDETITADKRKQALIEWTSLPNARYAHEQEDHLIPLHVIVGAARGAAGKRIMKHDMAIMGNSMHFVADSYMFD